MVNDPYTSPRTEQRVEPGARFRAGERPTMAKLVLPLVLTFLLGFLLGWATKPDRVVTTNRTAVAPARQERVINTAQARRDKAIAAREIKQGDIFRSKGQQLEQKGMQLQRDGHARLDKWQ